MNLEILSSLDFCWCDLKPICRSQPVLRRKNGYCIKKCIQLLCQNSTIRSRLCQLFYCSFTNIWKYRLSFWFTCFVCLSNCEYQAIEEAISTLRRWYCYDQCLLETAWTWAKGMMTTIGCAKVVSVSASCSRCHNLISSFLLPHTV